ncbi:carboxypeptidase inhibitor SmCI-like isoform X1 [Rhipicephalus microplus]|uniref:carboxypeptidase inhibitor SmCI-like isoform X1 n=1 Tax=Rhipicephalus microplus TaxID=6941 RepID=UPI003F6BF953
MKVQSCMLILLCTLQAHGWNCFKNCRTKKPTHLPTPSTCLNPPVLGYCNPLLEAWHYDHNKGRCTKVNPSLCGTGKNLFGKESHCLQACSNPVGLAQIFCLIPPVLVSSSPFLLGWYFEVKCSCCRQFNYTLGSASANKFSSELQCQQVCQPNKSPKAVCSLEPIAERCLLTRNHWYFDKTKNRCFRFRHGKCAKNRNGFRTLVRCMERCSYFLPTTVSNSASASKEPE